MRITDPKSGRIVTKIIRRRKKSWTRTDTPETVERQRINAQREMLAVMVQPETKLRVQQWARDNHRGTPGAVELLLNKAMDVLPHDDLLTLRTMRLGRERRRWQPEETGVYFAYLADGKNAPGFPPTPTQVIRLEVSASFAMHCPDEGNYRCTIEAGELVALVMDHGAYEIEKLEWQRPTNSRPT